jgi:hypothetical protein
VSDFEIAVGIHDNKVVLKIGRVYQSIMDKEPQVDIMAVVPLDIQNALDIAEGIAKKAFECRGDIVPSEALKVDLAEKHAKILVPRIMNVMRSTEGKPARYRSECIVGVCLSEVLG